MSIRKIDYPIRVGGDITVPAGSIMVGGKITLSGASGKLSAISFEGNGSLLTNLSSSAMPDALLKDGSRAMTGDLQISKNNASIILKSPVNALESGGIEFLEEGSRFATDGNGFRIAYNGIDNQLYIKSRYGASEATHMQIDRMGGIKFLSNINMSGDLTVSGLINAVDIAKLKNDFDLHKHDDRYYTESEMDGKLLLKSDASHNHDSLYALINHNHNSLYAPLNHNHDSNYTKSGSTPESVLAKDKRTWTPADLSNGSKEFQFAFTRLNLDNTGEYVDAILASTYSDASGGGVNALMMSKSGSGIYHGYAGWNGTSWSTKRLAYDADKADKSISISTGAGLNGGGNLSANRTLSVIFGTAAGTVAEGNHGHAIGDVTGLQAALNGKSDTLHSHTFASLTGRPTTLSGYGITDAALGNHNHDSTYLKLSGGTVNGTLDITNGLLRLNTGALHSGKLTTGNTQLINSDTTTVYAGNPATALMLESNANPRANIAGTTVTLYHSGNFNPADKADASALSTHAADSSIHKDWGLWDTNNGQDLRVRGKRAIVGLTTELAINYGGDFPQVNIYGTLKAGGNTIWHAGNLNPANFIGSGTGQSVGGGFSVKGRLLVGNTSGVTGDAILYDDNNNATIHLDGNASGIESSTATKVHILGNGNAMFKETVTAKVFIATSSGTIPALNTTTINGVNEKNFTKNETIVDHSGWGIISGMDCVSYGGELHVEPGVSYTKSGRRVEVTTRSKVNITPPPGSGVRYDIAYIKGPSASTEEGMLAYLEGAVGQSAATSLSNGALSDAVILATVKRETAQASITQADINNAVRDAGTTTGRKPFYMDPITNNMKVRYELHANRIKEGDLYLSAIYSTLNGGNVFTSNQKFDGRVHINTTGSLGLDPKSNNYALRVGNNSNYIAMDDNEILATTGLFIKAVESVQLIGTRIELMNKVVAPRNAATVTIPAGQTSVKWTHNYGTTKYAVNLTSNSFERHVRWTDKTSTQVTIELDDPSSQETLVDIILIGYE